MGKAKRLKAIRKSVREKYPHHKPGSQRKIYRQIKQRQEEREGGGGNG